jgi:hypothetical protein
MKFKITRPDGTIIEGEGAADDVLKLLPVQFTFAPTAAGGDESKCWRCGRALQWLPASTAYAYQCPECSKGFVPGTPGVTVPSVWPQTTWINSSPFPYSIEFTRTALVAVPH